MAHLNDKKVLLSVFGSTYSPEQGVTIPDMCSKAAIYAK